MIFDVFGPLSPEAPAATFSVLFTQFPMASYSYVKRGLLINSLRGHTGAPRADSPCRRCHTPGGRAGKWDGGISTPLQESPVVIPPHPPVIGRGDTVITNLDHLFYDLAPRVVTGRQDVRRVRAGASPIAYGRVIRSGEPPSGPPSSPAAPARGRPAGPPR